MRNFFVNRENIFEDTIQMTGSDVNHIKNVLRMKAGDIIQICEPEGGNHYICKIEQITAEMVQTKILEEMKNRAEGNIQLHIFQGLPKADKMEQVLQKGTELGAACFVPVKFKRCVVKWTEKEENKKRERWRKIVENAAKQSRRDSIPAVQKAIDIGEICNLVSGYDIILLAYEEEKENELKQELLKLKNTKESLKIAIVIGPEGGIEKEEAARLKEAGCKAVSLGRRILRTETVALAVCAIVMYELETREE